MDRVKIQLCDSNGVLLGETDAPGIPYPGEMLQMSTENAIPLPEGALFKVEEITCVTVTVSAGNLQTLDYLLHRRDKAKGEV